MRSCCVVFYCTVLFISFNCIITAQEKKKPHNHADVPGVIVQNRGQWNADVLYADMLGRYGFERDGMTFSSSRKSNSIVSVGVREIPLQESSVRPSLRFMNMSSNAVVSAGRVLEGLGHMYTGSDSLKWHAGMPLLGGVRYANVWDSVDVEYLEDGGKLLMTLTMRPGARLRDVKIASTGSEEPIDVSRVMSSDERFSLRRESNVGNTVFSICGYGDTVAYRTEFSTYIHGFSKQDLISLSVDVDGSIFLQGSTLSERLNVRDYYGGRYIMHLDCDGKTILYSTVYASDSNTTVVYDVSNGDDGDDGLCIRKNGNVIATGDAWISHIYLGRPTIIRIPLTPDALEKPTPSFDFQHASFILELDGSGYLHYASLFGYDTSRASPLLSISSTALDSHENLCMTAEYIRRPKLDYFTSGTIDSDPGDSCGVLLVKLGPELNSVIWGTRIGPYGCIHCWDGDDGHDMAIDSLDNIIIVGLADSNSHLILKNQIDVSVLTEGGNLYVQKVRPDGTEYVFSTYLGVSHSFYNGWCMSDQVIIGPENTIHVAGRIDSSMKIAPRIGNGYIRWDDGYYASLSPDGKLIRSFRMGGRNYDSFVDVGLDPAGNIFLHGWTGSDDFPIINNIVPVSSFQALCSTLTVIDAIKDTMLFSSVWQIDEGRHSYGYGDNCFGSHKMAVRPTGYVVFGESAGIHYPIFNAMHMTSSDSLINIYDSLNYCDGAVTRIFLPYAGQDFLKTTVIIPDSLRLELTQGIITGDRFKIRVRVVNPSQSDTAFHPDLIVKLPAGITIDSLSQLLTRRLSSPFIPGMSVEYDWNVHVSNLHTLDSLYKIRAFVEYDLEENPPTCERPYVKGYAYMHLQRYASPQPVYSCSIEAPDYLSVTADSLANNPFPVHCHIRNTGQSTFTLSGLRLALPTGSPAAIELVPAGDSLRPGGTLAPGEEMVRDWTVKALYFPNTYERVIKLVVIDTFGYRLPRCEKIVVTPGFERTACMITATDTVSYNTSHGMYLPSPLNVDLLVSSDLDTTLTSVTARLDLAHAPHLRLVTGDSLNRFLPPISVHGSMGARWRVEVVPHPSGPVSDTLFVYHRAPGWTEELWCMHVMRIIPPVKDVNCSLAAPVVTVTATNTYSPDTTVVKWIVMNNGGIAVSGLTAHLDMSCDPAWCLDAPDRSVGIVQPSERDSVTWRLVPKTSAFERDISLRVTARDSLGTEITSCDAVLHLPRIYPPLRCTLTCPDTLHYMSPTDSYDPDPFNATVTVENLVDTVMTASAQLDLSGASHLKLAPGETGQAALGIVQPHGTAQHTFVVAVSTPADQTSSEDIAVNAEGLFSTMQFESVCATTTVMQPRPSIHTAECFTAGHDTVWSDTVHEDIIPHPIQIRNGIINTGNDPLENCEAAIIIPEGYILTQPPDSIQKYAPIAPGDTGRREWLLEVDRNHPTPDPRTVRFVWHCDSGVQGECTRDVVLKASSPQGLVLSKWRLLFSAEMNMSIPASQKVSVWTGGNAPFAWQPVPDVSWLSATPSVLGSSGMIDIVTTTTAMSVGTYEGTVSIVTSEYARPVPIEISYEIWIKNDAKPIPTPSGMWLDCVPNPARPGGTLHIRYSVDKPGAVRIRLMDALGREVRSEYHTAMTTNEQNALLQLPASISPGAYFIVLEQTAGRIVKGVVVR